MRWMSQIFFVIILSFWFLPQATHAESNYILPYPSSMPGSNFYKLNLFWKSISKWWYFGSFGRLEYNLKQSDKYLVEAKTLFEYKQYLLAYQALKKSDLYFNNIQPQFIKATKENKNIVQKKKMFKEASLKHIEVLNEIKQNVPQYIVWRPEKSSPTTLNLKQATEQAIVIRKKIL